MSTSGTLEKMVLTAYLDESFSTPLSEMSVYINPASYTQSFKILYNQTQAQGSANGSPAFNKTLSSNVNFELIFDGTGVVPTAIPGVIPFTDDGITTQIDQFIKLAFNYDSELHSPNFIQIAWGTLLFQGRLCTLKITYTLFKPDGTPLRAKADVAFVGFHDQVSIEQEENSQSPDLSRVVTVRGGDTLPALCYGIYGSSVYYLQVAQANGLTNFRALIPGQKILFPPLKADPS